MQKVTPIFQGEFKPTEPHSFFEGSVKVPIDADGMLAIDKALAAAGLASDQAAVFMAHPNLKEATERLLGRISIAWPSTSTPGASAIVIAVVKAMRNVRRGIGRGERTRAQVVENYLTGLGTCADDVASVRAWGFIRSRSIEHWTLDGPDFNLWTIDKEFTEVRFTGVSDPHPSEVSGTRMKLLCSIANARDVGLLARFH